MTREHLDYASPKARETLPNQRRLGWLAAIVPFVVLPCYVLGTAVLQDDLVADGPGSWQRAALRVGIPTGLVALIALGHGINAVLRTGWRSAAGVSVVANALVLMAIAYGMFSP